MSLNLVITMMDRDRRESMEAIFKSVGLPMSLTMLGRGTATMEHLSLNGLKATEKAVLSTVADSDKTRQLMLAAKVKMFIDIPGNGIMLSVPIKSVGGGKTLAYLTENQKSGGKPDMTFAHELIYVILNEGCSDEVMDAAGALQPALTRDMPQGLLVTLRDVDARVREMGRLVGYGCDLALHRGLSLAEIPTFLS